MYWQAQQTHGAIFVHDNTALQKQLLHLHAIAGTQTNCLVCIAEITEVS